MKGRRSVWVRTGHLEARRPRLARSSALNLKALTDEELEGLLPLAEKLAAANGDPDWTPEEQALVAAVWAKATAPAAVPACGAHQP